MKYSNDEDWGDYWVVYWKGVKYSVEEFIEEKIKDGNVKEKAWKFFNAIKKETLKILRKNWDEEGGFIQEGFQFLYTSETSSTTQRSKPSEIPPKSVTMVTESEKGEVFESSDEDAPETREQTENAKGKTDDGKPKDNPWTLGKIAAVILLVVAVVGAGGAAVWKWLQKKLQKSKN